MSDAAISVTGVDRVFGKGRKQVVALRAVDLSVADGEFVSLIGPSGCGKSTLLTLRLPSSVPYLLPALRLAAASAVIGAVVAEVSIGLKGGLGRMVIDYAVAASGDPAKPWAPIFGAVVVGLVAAGAIGLLGLALRPFRLTGASNG